MEQESWVKIHRKIVDNEWWDDAEAVKMWLWLLMEANTENRRWKGLEVPRGQFITSIDKIALACQLTPKKVRLRLEWFEKSHQIIWERANKYSRIIICNYATYQDKNEQKGKQRANKGQTDGRQMADKGQTDDKQKECQTDSQTATTKEYKNNNIRENPNIISEYKNNNIRENPNIISENKNERIFFKAENEKKVFSIEEIKNSLAEAGIFWKPQGYLDFKENNENPEASFNYNGGIVKSAKQYQKLHPEIIGAKPKRETISYKSLEVAPDVKHTLHALLETSEIAESSRQMVENIVKPRITADKVELWAESKSQYEVFKDLFEAAGNLLQGHYNLPYVILG